MLVRLGAFISSILQAMKAKLAAVVKQKIHAQWCEIMEGKDVCTRERCVHERE
jgi:hypothetical protein